MMLIALHQRSPPLLSTRVAMFPASQHNSNRTLI